jgi:hypothetical protein
VMDAELGISGRSVDNRAVFEELMALPCSGAGGKVFALEVSRPTRSWVDLEAATA